MMKSLVGDHRIECWRVSQMQDMDKIIDELTLMLLYLTSWAGMPYRRDSA